MTPEKEIQEQALIGFEHKRFIAKKDVLFVLDRAIQKARSQFGDDLEKYVKSIETTSVFTLKELMFAYLQQFKKEGQG